MEETCGRSLSKSTVSEALRKLDKAVEAHRTRPIEGRFPFLMLDATFPKARVNHRIAGRAPMIAVGPGPDGRKEVPGARGVRQRGERQLAAEGEAALCPCGGRNGGQGAEAGDDRQAAGGAEEGGVG